MEKAYILAIDQSTQGTKAILLDENGAFVLRRDLPHKQLISKDGWVGHDAEEIARNILAVSRLAIEDAGIPKEAVKAVAVTNQRESVAVWDKASGKPVCESIVWQCNRAAALCERLMTPERIKELRTRTGLQPSPFFSAPKVAWILENVPGVRERAERGELLLGTMDCWTIWTLTGGREHKTDVSNANRTQLFNIYTKDWDPVLCDMFGIPMSMLPKIEESDGFFGETDLGGFLPAKIPIHSAVGDSNAVPVAHGCIHPGDAMCGYGTGSCVIVNIGEKPFLSESGMNTTAIYSSGGKTLFGLEGVINYSGAVVTWLKDNAHLISSAAESGKLAEEADPADHTYMVPAFTGIGAPHWRSNATAAYVGMTRLTGQKELVRAALESVAYQVSDLVLPAGEELGIRAPRLFVAGGPSKNRFLMQFQSDILGIPVAVAEHEEMSGIGSAYLCGLALGLYDEAMLEKQRKAYSYEPVMSEEERRERLDGWKHALETILPY